MKNDGFKTLAVDVTATTIFDLKVSLNDLFLVCCLLQMFFF